MRSQGERLRRSLWSLVALAVAAVSALVPAGAGATDSDLKHAFAFRAEASNGYSVLALAASERADGAGELVLFVAGKQGGVVYVAPAQLTATSIDADLGTLGRVALEVVPSGRKRTLHSRCDGGPQVTRFEPQAYRGSFEFHGEEGYADLSTKAPREYSRFFLELACRTSSGGEGFGPGLPGARLKLRAGRGLQRLSLQAIKNRPGADVRLAAELDEKRGAITIERSIAVNAGPDAFHYDPLLRTATIAPPAPFSGHGTFHRHAAPTRRWTGNLAIDFPGRSDVPLTGKRLRAHLIAARYVSG